MVLMLGSEERHSYIIIEVMIPHIHPPSLQGRMLGYVYMALLGCLFFKSLNYVQKDLMHLWEKHRTCTWFSFIQLLHGCKVPAIV